jgi:hypothetical protein
VSYLVAPERFEADGIVLRSYDVGDGVLLADAVNESYEHLRPWMPWAAPYQSVEDSEQLVRQFRGRYLLAEDFVIGIFSRDEQRLLGGTGFHLREGPIASGCAEIGMFSSVPITTSSREHPPAFHATPSYVCSQPDRYEITTWNRFSPLHRALASAHEDELLRMGL